MTSAMYLEHYLDSLETLPVDLQRNFNLMRDLDTRSQNVLKEIDDLADEYLATVRKLSPDSRTDKISVIQSLFTKSREYGDDKVQLAMQTYELVDKHIRRLDTDLARFEADLKDKIIGGTGTELKKKGTERKRKKKHKDDFDDEVPRKKKKKSLIQLPEVESPPPVIVPSISLAMAHQTEVLDMPVDPNEPTYCLCHQVSYGEMIGCDNVDCPIEWFHFACVGLTMKPKGKWYCPKCLVDRKKK